MTSQNIQRRLWQIPQSDCPGQKKILQGNQKLEVLCSNGQLKSKQGAEHEQNFCRCFDILTDVYGILFLNGVDCDSW